MPKKKAETEEPKPKRKRGRPPKSEAEKAAKAEEPKAKKASKEEKAPVKKSVRRSRKKDWPTLMTKIDESEIVDYNMNEDFSEIEAINHKKFGIGIIIKILADNKMEVVFEKATKVMAQNWE